MTSGNLMAGKRGLIMGVANRNSIAWGIAEAARNQGAELAFTYQGEAFGKRVRPLAKDVGAAACLECDVSSLHGVEMTFAELAKTWPDGLDFVVHAIAYSDKDELKGRYVDTSLENFRNTLCVSCYSFTAVAKAAEPMLRPGASLLTLTYEGAARTMPSYNVMGVAKAALEASVRYLAADLGPDGTRVNALSAGPMRTLAGSGIANARYTYNWQGNSSPMHRNIELSEVGNAGLYLLSDLSAGVTGEVHFVDSGYNVIGMAVPGGA